MAEMLVNAFASDGGKIAGAIWCDGPKPGTKWMTVKVLDRNRNVLIRRARKGEAHYGNWVVVE